MIDILDFRLSPDKATLQYDEIDQNAFCHFCAKAELLEAQSRYGLMKPKKWVLHIGGTKKAPQRFFICSACCGTLFKYASGKV